MSAVVGIDIGTSGTKAVVLRDGAVTAEADRKLAEVLANARLALMVALGELQKEMGPDMRVSAEAALYDRSEDSEEIDGVDQSRWLASYNSWGGWLNATYTPPGGKSALRIQDTYTPERTAMFRRWMVSLPDDMIDDVDAARNSSELDDANSVILVGEVCPG